MTPAREEQLISDVAETKALLHQFMREIKPTLATCQDVQRVENRLNEHTENHRETRNLWPVWIGLAVSTAIGFVGCFRGLKP